MVLIVGGVVWKKVGFSLHGLVVVRPRDGGSESKGWQ